MLITLLLIPVLLIAAVLVVAATRPDGYRVVREGVIAAPPERIHPHLVDFRAWAAWSPWEHVDPAMVRTFRGADRGVGAVYAWEGPKVGAGEMEITAMEPPTGATLRLSFRKPFASHCTVRFALAPRDGGTEVTWSMEGKQPFIGKVMCLFMDMDRLVGKDYAKGLANLKAVVEGA